MFKRLTALTLAVGLLLTPILTEEVYAGVIGESGLIPGGAWASRSAGGGVSQAPSFRVGIIDEPFSPALKTDDIDSMEENIGLHFQKHMPALADNQSILITPTEDWLENRGYARYLPGSGSISVNNKTSVDFNISTQHRKMEEKSAYRYQLKFTNMYANTLMQKFKDIRATVKTDEAAYAKLKTEWKALVKPGDDLKAVDVWSWLLINWDTNKGVPIEKKLITYTSAVDKKAYKEALGKNTEEGKQEAFQMKLKNKLGYLDLMMTLYAMGSDKMRSSYAVRIDKFITDAEIGTQPPLIAITTDVRVSAPTYFSSKIFMPSTDFINWIGGASPMNNLTSLNNLKNNPVLKVSSGYGYAADLIGTTMREAEKDVPNRKKYIDLKPAEYFDNPFMWGNSGVTGCNLRRDAYTNKIIMSNVKKVTGIMESLVFLKDPNYYGFLIVDAPYALLEPEVKTGGYSLKTNEPDPEILDEGSTILGRAVQLQVRGNFSAKEREELSKTLREVEFEAGYPQMQISITPDKLAGQLTTDANYKYVSPKELYEFVNNSKTYEYLHNTTSFPVQPDTSYTFNYTSEVKIKLNSVDDPIILEGIPGEASKTFYNPKAEDPALFGKYTSEATYYSELKEGSPNHEEFEAMAGVPTTHNLYFATGGSEFIAEITTKYYKDQESSRTYKSYFTPVDSEFKAGDTAPNVSVGGFSINAHTGGSQTKTWSGSIPNNNIDFYKDNFCSKNQ